MQILSIDVGIKNLALCLFEKKKDATDFSIIKWEVLNLAEKDTLKKCDNCNLVAKYFKDQTYLCTKHAKKGIYKVPLKTKVCLEKQTIKNLTITANTNNISYDKPVTKSSLLKSINEYNDKHCYNEIIETNASTIDLIHVSVNIKNKLNHLLHDIEHIDHIIIENQISPIASRMKTVQGMIVQYFVMSDITCENIRFVSASNKLRDVLKKGEVSSYSDRKKHSITRCLEIITTQTTLSDYVSYFNNHGKK